MNVFILCTGRCGSTTFIKACVHIKNFTSGHETRCKLIGADRFAYPQNHIEADNRLCWMLGRLDITYGDTAFYVHLKRDRQQTASSFVRRYDYGIIKAYKESILMGQSTEYYDPMIVCLDYYDTINTNIALFMKDKTQKIEICLDNIKEDFSVFWKLIGAQGDLAAALAEFEVHYNASQISSKKEIKSSLALRVLHKLKRLIVKLPLYLRNA